MKKPNILIIMADQMAAHALPFLHNQSPAITPNLQKLATQSAVFRNAYCPSPLCTPSRYGFMSGQYIKNNHGFDNAAVLETLKPTFAHYLRLNGYKTILSGKMHFVGADQLHGFEERLTTDVYPADFGWVPNWHAPEERIDLWYHNMSSVKQAGIASITNQLEYDDEVYFTAKRALYHHARNSDDTRPFAMVASFIHPHDPYAARQKYWNMYDGVKIPLPHCPRDDSNEHHQRLARAIDLDKVNISNEDIIRARRAYYANVTMVDEMVGGFIDVLRENDQLDNTIIIFTSDHGDMLGEYGLWYKMTFHDYASKVPLIIHAPGRFGHKIVDTPVSLIDILPTLNDLSDYKGPLAEPVDGTSLLPLIGGQKHPISITEYTAEGAIAPMLMIREDNYKFIYAPPNRDLLYNMANDPWELDNIAQKMPDLVAKYTAIAQQHWDHEQMRQLVIQNQDKRRILHQSLRQGKYNSWDYQPKRDYANEFSRSHLDLTNFDVSSRYPKPPAFP